MSQEILEKTNEISEGITEYMKTAADYAGGLGDAASMAYHSIVISRDLSQDHLLNLFNSVRSST